MEPERCPERGLFVPVNSRLSQGEELVIAERESLVLRFLVGHFTVRLFL